MTGAQSLPMPTHVAQARMWPALLRKEWRESRAALLTGLIVFWAAPALWELLWSSVDRSGEFIPFAWTLLVTCGWLYAAVLGAHTICRDWGHAQEHFLASRPVSPRAIVVVKLLTGCAVLAVVCGTAFLWDLWHYAATERWYGSRSDQLLQDVLQATVPVGIALLAAYTMAFALGVTTRQMLASMLFAVLVLLLWVAAPLLSSRLWFLYPAWSGMVAFSRESERNLLSAIGPMFLASTAVVLTGSAALALYSATRERVLRIGHRHLAWTMAGVVLLLFVGAMLELGNSLRVTDQAPTERGDVIAAQLGGDYVLVGAHVTRFHVDEAGRVTDHWVSALPRDFWAKPEERARRICFVELRQGWDIRVTGLIREEGSLTPRVFRGHMSWTQEGRLLTEWRPGPLPSDIPAEKALVVGLAADGETVGVVYARAEGDHTTWAGTLLLINWADLDQPQIVREVPLERVRPAAVVAEALDRAATGRARFVRYGILSLDGITRFQKVESIPLYDYSMLDSDWFSLLKFRSETPDAEWVTAGDHGYQVSVYGITAMKRAGANWEPVGRLRSSPLSMAVGGWAMEARLLDPGTLAALNWSALTVYDVRDPSRPRKVGFYNIHQQLGDMQILPATGRYVPFKNGPLIRILELPRSSQRRQQTRAGE